MAGLASDVDILDDLLPGRRLGWEIDDLTDELFGRRVDLLSRTALHERLRATVLAQPLSQGLAGTHGGRNASFDDFEAIANQDTGKDYTALIDAWFRGRKIPDPHDLLYPGCLGN